MRWGARLNGFGSLLEAVSDALRRGAPNPCFGRVGSLKNLIEVGMWLLRRAVVMLEGPVSMPNPLFVCIGVRQSADASQSDNLCGARVTSRQGGSVPVLFG